MARPTVTIRYCPRCKWLLRSAWYAQELLSTFEGDLGALTLIPDDIAGRFVVDVDGASIWDRDIEGRFPEAKELKRRVRDHIAPDRDLGHVDRKSGPRTPT